jgi:hypothetical protein
MDLGNISLSACEANLWGTIIGVAFSCVGLVALGYGKKSGRLRAMIIGGALLIYPYFVSSTLLTAGIGAALTASLFLHRD